MPYVERAADVIVVDTKYTQKDLVKSIPGSEWDGANKVWTVPLSWAACLQLRGIFGGELEVGPELIRWSHSEVQTRIAPALELRERLTRVEGFAEKLYDFQTAGAAFLTAAGDGAILGDDLGLGKTAQALATIQALANISTDDAFPALIVCPNSVKPGWANQIKKWNIKATPYVVAGSATQRRKIIEAARQDAHAIVIINIEAVRLFSRLAPYGSTRLARCRECSRYGEEKITQARCETHLKPLNSFGFKTVVIDEAHRCKDPSSKQTRACWAVAHDPSVKRRWALTGTPVVNHVGDLWSILHLITPREAPTKSKFVDRYGLQAWNAFGGLDIVGINPERRDEFYKILDPRFRRTQKALVLDQLPPVVRPTRWVEMSTKQRKAYDDLAKQLFTQLDSGEVLIAPNNLVNATRLLQLSSSYANVEWVSAPTDEDPHHMKAIVTLTEPSPKLDALEEDIELLNGKQFIVAAESRQLIELAAKRMLKAKISFGLITGPVSDFERQRAIQELQAGQIRAILMTMKAGGTGVDGLQCVDTMFCLQRSWSMIDNVQVDGRIHRIGSEVHNSVTIVDYVTRDSIEEHVQYPRLVEKYTRLDEINRDRVRLIAAGIRPEQMYELDRRQDLILQSNLGTP